MMEILLQGSNGSIPVVTVDRPIVEMEAQVSKTAMKLNYCQICPDSTTSDETDPKIGVTSRVRYVDHADKLEKSSISVISIERTS